MFLLLYVEVRLSPGPPGSQAAWNDAVPRTLKGPWQDAVASPLSQQGVSKVPVILSWSCHRRT